MRTFHFLLFSLSVTFTFAKPTPGSDLIAPKPNDVIPEGFSLIGPAPPNATLNLRMGLKYNNLPGLETALYDVSTPGNKLYGQHLTKEEVETYVAPSAETKSAVDEWLNANDIQITSSSPAGDWFKFSIIVSKANELFHANFSVFAELSTGNPEIRTLSYSLPASLEGHVTLVHPTSTFPVRSTKQFAVTTVNATKPTTSVPTYATYDTDVPASCATTITPDCILALYGLPSTVGPQNASQIGVSGFGNEFAQKSDLLDFLTDFRPDLNPPPTFAFQSVNGGQNIQNSSAGIGDVEANLDVQYTVGLAGGVPVTFISVGGPENATVIDVFFDFIDALIAEPNPPQVISVSYAFNELEISDDTAINFCNELMQLGARGVSILYSSGDIGVAGARLGTECTDFVPTFPNTCPYITSVGSTGGINPEKGSNFSAGGFSNVFPVPEYQKSAVTSYLERLGSTNAGLFNTTGRGFPDVAAQGQNFTFVLGGKQFSISGTSFSAPTFSSFIGQINALRIKRGESVLGFLNPLFYSTTSLFTDITSGNNPGCGTEGFSAASGWDPITGLGTPIFSAFEALP